MTRVRDKESFVKKAKQIHGDKFSYDKFEYINAKTKSIITCLIHGDFLQSADKHFNNKTPCPECYKIRKSNLRKGKSTNGESKLIPKEEYLHMLEEKYGNKFTFNLDNYIGLTKGSVTLYCKKHGYSTYTPRSLLQSTYGCRDCGFKTVANKKIKNYDNFLKKAKQIHGDKYIYPETNRQIYKNRKSTIEIICKEHGLFSKKAQKHIAGQGCFECRINELVEDGILVGGYNEELFSTNKKLAETKGFLYYLSVDNGKQYKIGITRNLYNRIKSLKSESKKEITLLDTLELPLYEAYKIEQELLNLYANNRVYTRWSTELFDTNILRNISLKEYCQKHTHTNIRHETA